jgi:hypothetical protein
MHSRDAKQLSEATGGVNRGARGWLFAGLWLFICGVSVIDGYLAYRHRHHILTFELNPIGRLLIVWNGGGVTYLLAAKFIGTVIAGAILLLLWKGSAQLGLVVAGVLAAGQLLLLLFLLIA